MKYKVINVYSGYGEMSINNIKEKESNDINSLIDVLFEELRDKICNEGGIDYWDEFSIKKIINKDIGYYLCSEEDFNLVISSDNEWYDKVNNYNNWNKKDNDKWIKFSEVGLG